MNKLFLPEKKSPLKVTFTQLFYFEKKKTLVLDLDETLVHSAFEK